jgi:hypothetical protein
MVEAAQGGREFLGTSAQRAQPRRRALRDIEDVFQIDQRRALRPERW